MHEHITVEWLLENEWFKKNVALVAGNQGLDRHVTYVTVQEAPDFYKQIEGGEFVLSTWYAFKDDLQAGYAALERLSDKVSGICIKIDRFIAEIPKEYIDFANSHSIPLFVVNKEIKFREIIKNVTLEINSAQTNTLLQLKDYYTYLFTSALNNGSADSMLLDFSRRTGLIAITLSYDFTQMRGQRMFSKLPNNEYRLNCIKDIIKSNHCHTDYFYTDEYHVFPCIARGYCYGYLIILNNGELSEPTRLFVVQLCNIITIKWLDRQENENEKLLHFLAMLNSPEENLQYLESYLNSKSIDYASGILAIQLKIKTNLKTNKKINLSIFQSFIMDLLSVKSNILYIWDKLNSFTILVDDVNAPEKVTRFLQMLRSISDKYNDITVSVGPVVQSISYIKDSIRASINALLFLHKNANFIYWQDHIMELAILGGAASYESSLFVQLIILPLIEHDHNYKDCVFHTLSSVIDNNSLEIAAKKEKLHSNSIRYRLQKIKNIIGLDFFNTNDKYVIVIAYLIHKNRDNYLYQ